MTEEKKESDPHADAWTAVGDALRQVEALAYQRGYDAGFYAGWDAAARRLSVAMQEQQKPDPIAPAAQTPLPLRARRSSMDQVLDYIRANPGKRGVEIAGYFLTDIPERTVRTALHRLKKAIRIKIVDDRWYLFDAPVDPQPTLLTER